MSEAEEKEPVFEVGDKIEWEVRKGYRLEPRWNVYEDNGGSGKWVSGEVRKVIFGEIETYTLDGRGRWYWPNIDHADYNKDQWQRPGYLRHKQRKEQTMATSETSILETVEKGAIEGTKAAAIDYAEQLVLDKVGELFGVSEELLGNQLYRELALVGAAALFHFANCSTGKVPVPKSATQRWLHIQTRTSTQRLLTLHLPDLETVTSIVSSMKQVGVFDPIEASASIETAAE